MPPPPRCRVDDAAIIEMSYADAADLRYAAAEATIRRYESIRHHCYYHY